MTKMIDRAGHRYGRLVVIGPPEHYKSSVGRAFVRWPCICDCGTHITVLSDSLGSGNTKSCGCLSRDVTSQIRRTHGDSRRREFLIWYGIKHRCYNPKATHYERYGGRGIGMDPAWHDFKQFFKDMGPRPSPDHSIDRIDNDKDYGPENCRWATRIDQGRNTRRNKWVTHQGRRVTLAELSELTGIKKQTICSRIYAGWPEDQLAIPAMRCLRKHRTDAQLAPLASLAKPK